jgi:AraC-like DNA-binding protein
MLENTYEGSRFSMSIEGFINLVPKQILEVTKIARVGEVTIFRPKEYITDVEIYSTGYHFVLPTSTPPPTKIEGKLYQFSKGKLIVFNPETKVLCKIKVPTEEYIDFSMNKEFFQNICYEVTGKYEIRFKRKDNAYSSRLLTLIGDLEAETNYFKEACPFMVKAIATQIAVLLLREAESNICLPDREVIPDGKYIKRAVEYIEGCYNSNITLEDICDFVHISQYHFIRMFKAHTGKTPHQYLLKLRLQKAEELLKSGQYKVDEVAKVCGFLSTGHFITFFKKIKGLTPLEYKKAIF